MTNQVFQAFKKFDNLPNEINELTKAQKELKEKLKDGTISAEEADKTKRQLHEQFQKKLDQAKELIPLLVKSENCVNLDKNTEEALNASLLNMIMLGQGLMKKVLS